MASHIMGGSSCSQRHVVGDDLALDGNVHYEVGNGDDTVADDLTVPTCTAKGERIMSKDFFRCLLCRNVETLEAVLQVLMPFL